jgi:hypothetical protein
MVIWNQDDADKHEVGHRTKKKKEVWSGLEEAQLLSEE